MDSFTLMQLMCACYLFAVPVQTQEGNDGRLNFLVVSDWGGLPTPPYSTPVETSVAKMMATTAEDIGAKFIVALGKIAFNLEVDLNCIRIQFKGRASKYS